MSKTLLGILTFAMISGIIISTSQTSAEDVNPLRQIDAEGTPVFVNTTEAKKEKALQIISTSVLETVELTYEVEMTHFLPWNPGDNLVIQGMTLEEQKEWVSNLETPRSQVCTFIYTIKPGYYKIEDISEPGPIYPIGRHQIVEFDLNKNTRSVTILVPDLPHKHATESLGEGFGGVTGFVLSYGAPSELTGDLAGLPYYHGSYTCEDQIGQVADAIVHRIATKETGDAVLEAKLSASTERLQSAVYYEDPYILREAKYGDYITLDGTDIDIPQQVTFSRYNNHDLSDYSDEQVIDRNEFTLVDVKTDI